MINIQKNVSLKNYNTFQIDAKAKYFVEIRLLDQLHELIKHEIFQNEERYILSGGSNTLFSQEFDGLVVHVNILGKKILQINNKKNDIIYIQVGSGENRDEFVHYCVEENYIGIENLVSIPGNIGAAPIQNIGAYGVEVKEFIHSVSGVHTETGLTITLSNSKCEFGYRDSVFKQALKNKCIVTHVVFKLQKYDPNNYYPNIDYQDIKKHVEDQNLNVKELTPKMVAEIIVEIRDKKLPDRERIGTAGSFFKNPIIQKKHFEKILKEYPEVRGYETDEGIKLSAGKLIDLCGLKGYEQGNVGIYEKHALILISNGKASGAEIIALMKKVQQDVKHKFGIDLKVEVNIV